MDSLQSDDIEAVKKCFDQLLPRPRFGSLIADDTLIDGAGQLLPPSAGFFKTLVRNFTKGLRYDYAT